jgi:adenylate cyclase
LAVEAVRVALGQPNILARANQNGMTGVSVGRVAIPTDIDGRVWIHFTARRPELYVAASDVLAIG